MTGTRADGVRLVFLGAIIFLGMGLVLQYATPRTTADFRLVYFSARGLLEGKDPYQPKVLEGLYRDEGGESAATPPDLRSESRYNYLPTALPLTVPFALLPFGPAHVLWLAFTAGAFILASVLIWDVAAEFSPLVAAALVTLTLVTSELLLILANPAGITISFCVIAAWCFLRQRYVAAGVLLLALSLMLKPHDGGLVWVYFLLSGRPNRKRAWMTLAAIVVMSMPAVLWCSTIAPGWTQEFRQNMSSLSAHGDVNDPGPASKGSHGITMITNLQAPLSLIRDDPHFYNPISYAVFGAILIVWTIKTLRTPFSQQMAWFALAPVSILPIIAIYHRVYDARIVLLTLPACMMLWKKGGARAWIALALCAMGIVSTGAVPWAIYLKLVHDLKIDSGFVRGALAGFEAAAVPVIMTALCVFYLYVYVQRRPDVAAS
ncbi:MAG: glycosyltransferase family 87 protein, partial [Terracidiphilus sp.]